jgi:3-mercaptopyruvate sulfurtransferase SseA
MLYLNGWRNMKILNEGIPGWIAKGYPTAGTEPDLKIEPHE